MENVNRDALMAITDSFNCVQAELDLLKKRLDWSKGDSDRLDNYGSKISKIKDAYDNIFKDYMHYENKDIELKLKRTLN